MKKFIVLKVNEKEIIYTFHSSVQHNNMYKRIIHSLFRDGFDYDHISLVSAGFYLEGMCYDESYTLDLKARGKEDEKLLTERTHVNIKLHDDNINLPIILKYEVDSK